MHICQTDRLRNMLDVLMSQKNVLKSDILEIARKNQTFAFLDSLC